MKKVLVINGSNNEIMLIQAAKRLGYYVITTGNNPSLIGHKYADKYVNANYSKYDLILKLAENENIDAVISNCNDLGMMTATYVNNKLKLPGVYDDFETARIFHEKDAFKSFISKHNFLTPKSEIFDNYDSALEFLTCMNFPVMVKPIDSCGGRGITKVLNKNESTKALQKAFNQSIAKRIVIEEYIEGRQYDLHAILQNEKVILSYASNEYTYKNPFRVSCLTLPADHSDIIKKQIVSDIERMANILHIKDGLLWLQYRVKDDKAYIIESARRCGGNNMIDLVSNAYGKDFGEYIVRLETGLDYKNFLGNLTLRKPQGYQSFMAPSNGIIERLHIDNDLREHIYKEYYWNNETRIVDDFLHDEFGVVLFEYDTVEEMSEAVKTINDKVKIIMK